MCDPSITMKFQSGAQMEKEEEKTNLEKKIIDHRRVKTFYMHHSLHSLSSTIPHSVISCALRYSCHHFCYTLFYLRGRIDIEAT